MQKGKIEIIAYHAFSIPFLGLSRDIVFHAMGCDCMKEGAFFFFMLGIFNPKHLLPINYDVSYKV